MFIYTRILCALLLAIRQKNAQKFPHLYQHALHGSLKPTDAFILADLLRKYRPKRILEVGSFLGVSSRWILEITTSWQANLLSVDPNIPHRVYANPRGIYSQLNKKYLFQRLELIDAFFGSCDDCLIDYLQQFYSVERCEIDALVQTIPVLDKSWDQCFDFIFIDGEHTYDSVMNNFEIARSLITPGGCIAFHDALSWEGVSKALHEIAVLFDGKASIEILGQRDLKWLKMIGRANDGIGIFRLLT